MSHHLDTPLAGQNGRLYIDDLYVFLGERSTVFIMDVNSTITGPDVQPGFDPDARYEFKVHFSGADFEELTYRVSFDERDAQGRQTLRVHALTGNEAREDGAEGTLVVAGRTGEVAERGGTRVWAGRIADPFYIDLDLLAIVDAAIKNRRAVDRSSWHPRDAKNSFANTTVESIVLQVPHDHPQLHPETPIGVWCTTKRATDAGGWRQINRFGRPMMWPIFWPDDTDFSDDANTRHPSADYAASEYIADAIAAVIAAGGASDDPEGYARNVVRLLFPDVMPYVVGTPASFGVRNGRALADNAPEVMFSLILNTAFTSGLTSAVAAHLRAPAFPYVVPA